MKKLPTPIHDIEGKKDTGNNESSIFSKYGVLGSIALISAFLGQVMTSDVKYNNKNNLSDGNQVENFGPDSTANEIFSNLHNIPPSLAGNDLADFLLGKHMECRQVFRIANLLKSAPEMNSLLSSEKRKHFEERLSDCGEFLKIDSENQEYLDKIKMVLESGDENSLDLVIMQLASLGLTKKITELTTSSDILREISTMIDHDYIYFENLGTIYLTDSVINNKVVALIDYCRRYHNISVECYNATQLSVDTKLIGRSWLDNSFFQDLIAKSSKRESISFNNCHLTAIPENIFKQKNLKTLLLTGNNITKIPEAITDLQYIEKIDLTGNQITNIPKGFSKLTKLKELVIMKNRLESKNIAIDFWKMENLISLELDNNLITKLPQAISGLKNLENLEISNNQIMQLPNNIAKLEKLKKLIIDGNSFSTIPEVIGNIKSLEFLGVSLWDFNVPESFIQLVNLNTLQLNNSTVIKLPLNIEKMKWLKILEVLQDDDFMHIKSKEQKKIIKEAKKSMPYTDINWLF